MVVKDRFIEVYVFVFCSLDWVFLVLGFHFDLPNRMQSPTTIPEPSKIDEEKIH